MIKIVVESRARRKGSSPVLLNHILDILGGSKSFLEDQEMIRHRLSDTDNIGKDGCKVEEGYLDESRKHKARFEYHSKQ